jgi:hypothetical protein
LGESRTPANAPSIEFDAFPVEEELPKCIADPQMQRTTPGHKETEAEEEMLEYIVNPQKQRTMSGHRSCIWST